MLVSSGVGLWIKTSQQKKISEIRVYDPPQPFGGIVYEEAPRLTAAEKEEVDRLLSYLADDVHPYSGFIMNKCMVAQFTAAMDLTPEGRSGSFSFAPVASLTARQLNCIMAQASGDVRVSFRDE